MGMGWGFGGWVFGMRGLVGLEVRAGRWSGVERRGG